MAKLKTKTINVEELVPYEANPRRNEKAVEAVKSSLQRFGYINPIIINEQDVVLAGHTRLKALKELGEKSVECIVIEGLTEQKQKAFRIADNRVGELADWNKDLLTQELKGVEADEWKKFGFTDKELKVLEPVQMCECPKCKYKFFRG